MNAKRIRNLILVLVFFAVVVLARQFARYEQTENLTVSEPEEGMVVGVIDGDTIDVEIGGRRERVRYIGIDAPEAEREGESAECFASEATEKNREFVLGKTVTLEKDTSERDAYGRLLRFVYAGDMFVNQELVRSGYATVFTYPPDVARAGEFKAAQALAREEGHGLWSACRPR